MPRQTLINQDEYDQLLDHQGAMCALCGDIALGRALAVDHDHATGKVRGLLCTRCNMGLGYFREDLSVLLRAAAYLALGLDYALADRDASVDLPEPAQGSRPMPMPASGRRPN